MTSNRYDICHGSENITITFANEDLKDKLGNVSNELFLYYDYVVS